MNALWWVPPVVGLGLLFWTLLRLERKKDFIGDHGKVRQVHHGYLGVVLASVGALGLVGHRPLWFMMLGAMAYIFGLWWVGDDAHQHYRQYREPFYRSAWHEWAASVGII